MYGHTPSVVSPMHYLLGYTVHAHPLKFKASVVQRQLGLCTATGSWLCMCTVTNFIYRQLDYTGLCTATGSYIDYLAVYSYV